MSIQFFMPMKSVPTVTHQEKRVAVVDGKPRFYEDARLKDARAKLTAYLAPHRPTAPLSGPLRLNTAWLFPCSENRLTGEYRTSKPDTDNLQKLLKDCMTACGFWMDDAQVAVEYAIKLWTRETPGILIEIEALDKIFDPSTGPWM